MHLRWTKSADGWGGDEDVSLAQVDTFTSRIEQVESVGETNRWDVWVFDTDTDLQDEDILVFDDLAVTIRKIAPFTKLNGTFHHYELLTEEHELTAVALLALLP